MLFRENGPSEVALFYYAGHGALDATGGYLFASDCKREDDGVSLSKLVALANASSAQHKIIILDSCHAGFAGEMTGIADHALLASGVTILSSCRPGSSPRRVSRSCR